MAQTTMTENPAVGFPGDPADTGPKNDLSKIVEEATGIPPGLGVVWGTEDNQVSLPSGTFGGADFVGFSVRRHKGRPDFALADNEDYQDEESIPVRRQGRLKVEVEDAFTAGGQVFVRHTAPGTEQLGAVRSDADTDEADSVTGVRFVTSGGAGEIGIIEINLP